MGDSVNVACTHPYIPIQGYGSSIQGFRDKVKVQNHDMHLILRHTLTLTVEILLVLMRNTVVLTPQNITFYIK